MGERPLLQIAGRLAGGEAIGDIRDVRGTCVRIHANNSSRKDTKTQRFKEGEDLIILPGYDEVKGKDKGSLRAYAEHFMLQRENADPLSAKALAELNDGGRWVIQNPPAFPLTTEELDRLYELPFTRKAHPVYDEAGGIDALKEVSFSLVSGRGCFGGCSFCSITFHQGRAVTGRSKESLLREAKALTALDGFKGYIHDVGGPTANFYRPACAKQKQGGFCADRE
jgi:uncharacterized radical SAM protein YgiQ